MGPRAVSTDIEPGKNPGWKVEVPDDDEVPKGTPREGASPPVSSKEQLAQEGWLQAGWIWVGLLGLAESSVHK